MSHQNDDDGPIGYGNPPRKYRWKKGQSGNPRRRRTKPIESTVTIIDRLLTATVSMTINGEVQRIPALQAIVSQLVQRDLSGNPKAARALLKYQEFASRNTERKSEVTFVDNDYTDALSNKSKPLE